MSEPVIGAQPDHALARLDKNLHWYNRLATRSHQLFITFKILSIVIAASIPVLSGFGERLLGGQDQAIVVIGLLGATIVVTESFLRLFQWEQHWHSYRTAWQVLDREKALYLSRAGPFADAQDPHRLLAERVEELISRENQSWAALQREKRSDLPPN